MALYLEGYGDGKNQKEEVSLALDPRKVELISHIRTDNSGSVLKFGHAIQSRFGEISQDMLRSVREKPAKANAGMDDLARVMRGFSIRPEDLRERLGFFEKLLGRKPPLVDFRARLDMIITQVDAITEDLLRARHHLRVDLRRLEGIYDRCKEFHGEIADHVDAGRAKLMDIEMNDLPRLQAARDAATGHERDMCEHRLHEMILLAQNLERRIHDLELTRIAAMQALPSIRILQENSTMLVARIDMMVNTTIPLWQSQMAHAVRLETACSAARSVSQASRIAQDALRSNARALNDLNRDIRAGLEAGGLPDIEAMKAAQAQLLQVIDESMKVVEKGAQARARAERSFEMLQDAPRSLSQK